MVVSWVELVRSNTTGNAAPKSFPARAIITCRRRRLHVCRYPLPSSSSYPFIPFFSWSRHRPTAIDGHDYRHLFVVMFHLFFLKKKNLLDCFMWICDGSRRLPWFGLRGCAGRALVFEHLAQGVWFPLHVWLFEGDSLVLWSAFKKKNIL